jgi:LuxR family maltose regulon positive regulatory protein
LVIAASCAHLAHADTRAALEVLDAAPSGRPEHAVDRNASPAPAARATPPRPRRPMPTGRPQSTSPPKSRTGLLTATGSRAIRARAGLSSCASTALCNRSSTGPGDPARSTGCGEAVTS